MDTYNELLFTLDSCGYGEYIQSLIKYIKRSQLVEFNNEKFTRAIIYNSQIAGIITYTLDFDIPTQANIGYFLGPQFTKKGIAVSALKTLTQNLVKQRLKPVLYIMPENTLSQKVAISAGYIIENTDSIWYNKTMYKYTLPGINRGL